MGGGDHMGRVAIHAREDILASANRGLKRRCASCGTAFYDLNRTPVICPKCQSAYVAVQRLPVRASRGRAAEPVLPDTTETAAFDEHEVLEHTEDEEGGELAADMEGDDDELRE